MPKKESSQIYTCCHCNEHFSSLTQFYKTYSTLYSETGYLPICKKCLGKLFEIYIEKYHDTRKAMQRICMAFDLYFSDSLFETCNNDVNTVLGNYIKRLNMVQYKGKTFDTSLEDGFNFGNDSSERIKSQMKQVYDADEPGISPDDIERWGPGFEPLDYDTLNSHCELLKRANPNCDSNQDIFITDLCYTKMQQMKAVREGKVDDYNKLTESYRKTFSQAGLKTVKDSAADENITLGVTTEMIEKYTPAEYYKDKKLYRDYDNLGEYINRFLFRPLKNLMFGTQDRDYEYYVKDEGDTDGYSEEE